jgi:heavy metal translocating P-type ATPase
VWSAIRGNPLVFMTVVVAVVAGVLTLAGYSFTGIVVITVFGLAVAGIELVGMIKQLRSGTWGIDILALIAILATLAVGEVWATLVIVVMLSGGQALDRFAEGRATRELSALLERAPHTAHVIDEATGDVRDVAVTEVAVGDRVLIRNAEVVPVDGTLASESGTFDESSVTGESLPVERSLGELVLSGSLNGQAATEIVATATAADSNYQQIISLVSEAAESKAPLVRIADRYAVPFTIFSLILAGAAWAISGDPVRFAEVLVVATPCPLLLAAPVAFLGGMSRAARQGIIVKGGGTLETLSRTRTIAFDKTGTLTAGRPVVVAAHANQGFSENQVLAWAASAEVYSTHVLAASIVLAANERGLDVEAATNAREELTNGVVATIGGREVRVGKRSFIEAHAEGVVTSPLEAGQLSVYVSADGVAAGSIVLSDAVREEAASTLAELRALGITRTLMLTGDARETANHIGSILGVEEVHSALLPEGKVDIIRGIEGRPVVMVGDGVNDAPVLAVADVGIAMGARGSTAASESADVVILIDDLSRTAEAVRIGKRTMRIARQSIWLGIALSIGLMIIATFGLLPAIIGAALQEVVDLATILNSLRALTRGRTAPVRDVARAEELTRQRHSE